MKRILWISILLAVIASSLVRTYFFLRASTGAAGTAHLAAFGRVVAAEVANLMNHQGEVVVVDRKPKGDDYDPSSPTLQGFESELPKRGKIAVVHAELIRFDRTDPEFIPPHIPGEVYLRLIRDYPEATMIVSFIGAPLLADEELRNLPTHRPRLLAVLGAPVSDAQALLDKRLIDLAFVPRETIPGTYEVLRARP